MSEIDWRAELQKAIDTPVDYEVIYGHSLPQGWESWEDYARNGPTQDRQAEQLLTGQEP